MAKITLYFKSINNDEHLASLFLPLLHARADVGFHSLLVRVYLLNSSWHKISSFSQLSFYSAQIYSLVLKVYTSSHDCPTYTVLISFLHWRIAVNHCRYVASLGGCSK